MVWKVFLFMGSNYWYINLSYLWLWMILTLCFSFHHLIFLMCRWAYLVLLGFIFIRIDKLGITNTLNLVFMFFCRNCDSCFFTQDQHQGIVSSQAGIRMSTCLSDIFSRLLSSSDPFRRIRGEFLRSSPRPVRSSHGTLAAHDIFFTQYLTFSCCICLLKSGSICNPGSLY